MKVYSHCRTCAGEVELRTGAETRVQLAMEKGDSIRVDCPNCQAVCEVNVDEFNARPSQFARTVALIVLIAGTPLFLWFFFSYLPNTSNVTIIGGVVLLPIIIYGALHKQEANRIHTFNAHTFK